MYLKLFIAEKNLRPGGDLIHRHLQSRQVPEEPHSLGARISSAFNQYLPLRILIAEVYQANNYFNW